MLLRRGVQFAPGYRLLDYLGAGQFGQVWRASGPGGVALAVKFIDLLDGRSQREFAAVRLIKSISHANLMPITAVWQLDDQGNVMEEPPEETERTVDLGESIVAADMATPKAAGDNDTKPNSEPDFTSTASIGFEMANRSTHPMASDPPRPATLIVGMLLGQKSLEKFLPGRQDSESAELLTPVELIRIIEGVARGLDFLNAPVHDFGHGAVSLQHGDIKPANIVLIGNSAVICDFGLARVLSHNQIQATAAIGTPAYMSPEAIDARPSRTSDQYSLAVTYYHLRTGNLPHGEGTLSQVLQAHRTGNLRFDGVSDEEEAILQRATSLDWQQRYDTNTDFVDELRRVLIPAGQRSTVKITGRSGDGAFASTGDPSTVPQTLGRRVAPWIAAASLLFGGIVGGTWWSRQRDETSGQVNRSGNGQAEVVASSEWIARSMRDLDADVATARQSFTLAVTRDPSLLRVPMSSADAHADAVEIVLPLGSGGTFLSAGYDASPKLWQAVAPEFFPMGNVLQTLPANVVESAAVAVSADDSWVFIGAGESLRAWPADQLRESTTDTLPTPPAITWELDDEVLCVAADPNRPSRLVVGLANQSLVVIDAANPELPAADSPSTSLSVIPRRLLVTPAADVLLVTDDDGAVRAMPWQSLLANQRGSDSVTLTASEIVDAQCWTLFDNADSPSLLVGHASGAMSAVRVAIDGGDNGTAVVCEPILSSDAANQDSVSVIVTRPVVKDASAESTMMIVTGAIDGSLAIRRSIDDASPRRIALDDGPIRTVAMSPDGQWILAGTSGGAWVLRADAAESDLVRLPTEGRTVDKVLVIPAIGRLLAGCGDGRLVWWSWDHARLRTLVPPIRSDSPTPATQPPTSKPPEGRLTRIDG